MASETKPSVLIGRTYGRWTVVGIRPGSARGHITAECRCECGLLVGVKVTNLYSNRSTQCLACSMQQRADKYVARARGEA